MRLYLFRLSLTAREGPGLFAVSDPRFDTLNRTDFLKEHLAKFAFDFENRKIALRFEPDQISGNVLSGVIARWITEQAPADPADLWSESEQNHWEKASFFLNLDPHEQVVGMEYNYYVGKPGSVLKGLVSTINERSGPAGYKIDVFPINPQHGFKDAVKSFPRPITLVTFDLVTPNPTDAAGATSKALKKLRKRIKAERYKATATSKTGLDVQDKIIQSAATYAEMGGGDAIAKSDGITVYDSRTKISTVEVADEMQPNGKPIEGLAKLADELKRT